MSPLNRESNLHIRTSERDKAILARAARAKKVSLSQFVLGAALPVAEEVLKKESESFGVVASMETLSLIWDSPEEDAAWADL